MSKELTISSMSSLPALTGSLDSYITAVNQIPVLSAAEERELAKRVHDHNDVEAAHKLVLSHLRFVVYIARGYAGYGLPLGDLIQEGNIGLMKAVKRFDPSYKVRLVSFAVHWIRAEIHEFILKNWRILKVATTKAHRKLFFNLRKAKQRLGWLREEEVNAIAQDLGVKSETVLEMESRLYGQDISFESSVSDDDDDNFSPQSWLVSQEPSPEQLLISSDEGERNHHLLLQGMDKLDDRSLEIIRRRWLSDKKATLQELADKFGVSAERIRQLETAAMKKLKAQMVA